MVSSHTRSLLLLAGKNRAHSLSILDNNEHIWTKIFTVIDDWRRRILDSIDMHSIACKTGLPFYVPDPDRIYRQSELKFPVGRNINVNMLPIKLFDLTSVPQEYRHYLPLIMNCPIYRFRSRIKLMPFYDKDHVAYLTIHECWVNQGETQRRPGIHIDSPRTQDGGNSYVEKCDIRYSLWKQLAWGLGWWKDDIPLGGIFMASNVPNSCKIWPVKIKDTTEITNCHGQVNKSCTAFLGEPQFLKADELCWMTDTTPHESLPSDKQIYRQFFRLVIGKIDVWYSQHNTPNCLGVLPDCVVSDENKFNV